MTKVNSLIIWRALEKSVNWKENKSIDRMKIKKKKKRNKANLTPPKEHFTDEQSLIKARLSLSSQKEYRS